MDSEQMRMIELGNEGDIYQRYLDIKLISKQRIYRNHEFTKARSNSSMERQNKVSKKHRQVIEAKTRAVAERSRQASQTAQTEEFSGSRIECVF